MGWSKWCFLHERFYLNKQTVPGLNSIMFKITTNDKCLVAIPGVYGDGIGTCRFFSLCDEEGYPGITKIDAGFFPSGYQYPGSIRKMLNIASAGCKKRFSGGRLNKT